MIVKTTLAISAEHPNLPLDTAATFVGSAVTFSITGVPALPAISVSAVAVSVTNANGAVSTVAAVSGEDGWTATFPASHFAAAGTVKDGVVVAVSGTDENGAARTWTAGVGAIVILSSSPVPAPGEVVYNLRLHDAEPDAPTDGDVWPDGDGGFLLWQDGEAHALGGGSSVTVDDALSDTSENPVQNKVVTEAVDARPTKAQIDEGWWSEWTFEFYIGGEWVGVDDPSVQSDITSVSLAYDGNDGWQVTLNLVSGSVRKISPSADAHDENATRLGFAVINEYDEIRATRHRVAAPVPTNPNDIGAQAALTAAQLANIAAVPNKADASDVAAALALKADASSLPYALVTVTPTAGAPFVLASCFPIKYTFEDTPNTISSMDDVVVNVTVFGGYEICDPNLFPGSETPVLEIASDGKFSSASDGVSNITFGSNEDTPDSSTQVLGFTSTAQLIDRASAAVSLTAAATLTMPAVSVAGHARDLVVRLDVEVDGLNITWGTADAGGVAVDYETEDGNFPYLSAAGTYLVRLTETAAFVAGTGGAADVPAKFLIQCQPLQTAVAGGGV